MDTEMIYKRAEQLGKRAEQLKSRISVFKYGALLSLAEFIVLSVVFIVRGVMV
jgi:hypothetical protein